MSRPLALILLALFLSAWSTPATAQCAMCREAAASQREEAATAFNRAIILLGTPPALIMAGIGRALWRRRDSQELPPPASGLQ
jgi:hypothetical protein